jgi:hypothetical protein
MTITTETRRHQYTSTGGTGYDFDFLIYDESEIKVVITDDDGNETTKTLTTDYTVSGVGIEGGGRVSLNSAPTAGYLVTLVGSLAYKQEDFDPSNGDAFDAETVEKYFDRTVIMCQQLKEEVDRKIGITIGSSASGSTELLTAVVAAAAAAAAAAKNSAEAFMNSASGFAQDASGFAAIAEGYKDSASGFAAAAALYAAGSGQKTYLDEPIPPTSSSGLTFWGETSGTTGYTDLKAVSTSGAIFYVIRNGRVCLDGMTAEEVANHNHYSSSSGGNVATSGTGTADIPAKWDHYHTAATVIEKYAVGTQAGASVIGYNYRTLNTKTDPWSIVSLSGGSFILGPGKYMLAATAAAYAAVGVTTFLRFWNATAGTQIGELGLTTYIAATTGNRWIQHSVPVSLSVNSQIYLQQYFSHVQTYGLGYRGNISDEIYAMVEIIKLG